MVTLHWLPVWFRIEYKVLLLAHTCSVGTSPKYLSDLLKEKMAKWLKTYGGRVFSVAAPHLWNKLPKELRTCKVTDKFTVLL